MVPARSHRRRAPLLALALAVALAVALAAAVPEAVGRGVVAGPSLNLQLGGYALVARTTEHPDCLPLPQQCFIPRPTFQIPQPRYSAVWAGRITYPERQGRLGPVATVSGRHLLRVAVRPAE